MPMLKQTKKHETTYVTISEDEYESMRRTIEVLGDKELMEQIKDSKNSEGRSWKDVKKELGI